MGDKQFVSIAKHFEIRKLVIGNDVCPFDEWFDELSNEDQYMVISRLARVELGSFGEINNVGNGVWELKFRKRQAIRIYYGKIERVVVLLICGGDKRSQQRDIRKAKELFSEYKERTTCEKH